jgi:hypothetical protein
MCRGASKTDESSNVFFSIDAYRRLKEGCPARVLTATLAASAIIRFVLKGPQSASKFFVAHAGNYSVYEDEFLINEG